MALNVWEFSLHRSSGFDSLYDAASPEIERQWASVYSGLALGVVKSSVKTLD